MSDPALGQLAVYVVAAVALVLTLVSMLARLFTAVEPVHVEVWGEVPPEPVTARVRWLDVPEPEKLPPGAWFVVPGTTDAFRVRAHVSPEIMEVESAEVYYRRRWQEVRAWLAIAGVVLVILFVLFALLPLPPRF